MSCEFCETADFSRFCTYIGKPRSGISLVLCNTQVPKSEQFKFCPECGRSLTTPKPLAVEQLRDMDGNPVWVIARFNGIGDWEIVNAQHEFVIDKDGCEASFAKYDSDDYGWIAYTYKPKSTNNRDCEGGNNNG